ncbi:DUF7238 family protein [Enterobacter cloacae complex sp. 363J6]|uniref:DUF7238 family protein n=1 Tax=Enterobacter cloacae complex sp. 363J6 TaxID=3395868 RepID=UPI003CF62583
MKCTAVVDELMNRYYERKENARIKDPKSIAIIERYAMKLSEQDFTPKAINSLMILKLLIASGDDMPHDENSAESFQKAYRSWGVIYSRSLGSYDSVMWNLMHLDRLIWEVLEEEGIV